MSTFNTTFVVDAPVSIVSEFHKDSSVLKKLTPPPSFVQIISMDPLAEGSETWLKFWFGPFPVRWLAKHEQVDLNTGFTDIMVEGPLLSWKHTHRYTAISPCATRMDEHIVFQHRPGIRSLWTRLIYNSISLRFVFAYRAIITRWICSNYKQTRQLCADTNTYS